MIPCAWHVSSCTVVKHVCELLYSILRLGTYFTSLYVLRNDIGAVVRVSDDRQQQQQQQTNKQVFKVLWQGHLDIIPSKVSLFMRYLDRSLGAGWRVSRKNYGYSIKVNIGAI